MTKTKFNGFKIGDKARFKQTTRPWMEQYPIEVLRRMELTVIGWAGAGEGYRAQVKVSIELDGKLIDCPKLPSRNTVWMDPDHLEPITTEKETAMKKTIQEWFESFPEPYRTQAIEDCEATNNCFDRTTESAAGAIMGGIHWSIAPNRTDWIDVYNSLTADPDYLTKAAFKGALTETPVQKAKMTRLDWLALFPEPWQSVVLENYEAHPNSGFSDTETIDTAATAVSALMYWARTPQGESYWMIIQNQVRGKNTAKEIAKALSTCEPPSRRSAFDPFEEPTPTAAKTSTKATPVTKKETTTMKNATYSVSKLLAKATTELEANEAAVAKYNAALKANEALTRAVEDMMKPGPDGKDKLELSALRQVALPEAVTKLLPEGVTVATKRLQITIPLTTPNVTDHTRKLAQIITDLGAQAEDKISWNDDTDFILADFAPANGTTTRTEDRVFSLPEIRS